MHYNHEPRDWRPSQSEGRNTNVTFTRADLHPLCVRNNESPESNSDRAAGRALGLSRGNREEQGNTAAGSRRNRKSHPSLNRIAAHEESRGGNQHF